MIPCLMVLVTEFVILRVQIHSKQGYCGGGDPAVILQKFCPFHLQYGGLVGPADVASLKYPPSFWKPRYLQILVIPISLCPSSFNFYNPKTVTVVTSYRAEYCLSPR